MKSLNQILNGILHSGNRHDYSKLVPQFIYNNLKEGYGKRAYQQEAFGRFIYYWNEYRNNENAPIHLLYHMATGSGKTLVMAGLIVYLYERGYRNFLFFVNSSNILEKTKENFLNSASSKYLFAHTVTIDGKQVRIREVDNLQAANYEDINIVFSTIQGLHSRLNTPKENSLTYDDFEDNKIVIISDEAHHINAETKKGTELSAEEKAEMISWEGTVNKIINANIENVMLEFTATADFTNPAISKKYADKLIFDYPLKQFRIDGYSKEVKVLQADLPAFERALQAVLLSQFRRKIFEKYKKVIKPVILFKSKTIKESVAFFDEFVMAIRSLKPECLEEIKRTKPNDVIERAFDFFEANNITLENLIHELQEDFSKEKLISVNSKDETEQKQIAINSLEDESNEYRAVFAVDKLNEGWDVLNLFDIVRLFDTRDSKIGKLNRTTMSEAQLIGRGARYCPFRITHDQQYYMRKYDGDDKNELKIGEELYYHSSYNPNYIKELNSALEEIGIKATHVESSSVKTGIKSVNSASTILPGRKGKSKDDIDFIKEAISERTYKVSINTGFTTSSQLFGSSSPASNTTKKINYKLMEFGSHVIRKIFNRSEFYHFSNLKKHFPHLTSVAEFISSTDYLGNVKLEVELSAAQVSNLSPEQKLEAVTKVLDEIASIINSNN